MSVSNQKIVSSHTFIDGINTMLASELMPPTAARFILNCNILSQGEGSVGIITNVKGNSLVSTPLPTGENICIGTVADEEANMFYFFVWNSNKSHTIQKYNDVSKTIITVLENIVDTDNVDILKFDKDYLILHADIIKNELLYWVDGLNNARKTNIKKLEDNSETGYGPSIQQEFIDAYKQTNPFAPTAYYFSDATKPFNNIYGMLCKFAQLFIYDDGEKSNVSDFSAVPLPEYEPFTGVGTIPLNNNGIKIAVGTGDRTVKSIEIFMQSTSGEINDEGLVPWVKIAVLDKDKLDIGDNSTYTYIFYNDTLPIFTDQSKIYRPYSFMPMAPRCQSFVKNALVYSNGVQGFPTVDIDMSVLTSYEDLFLDPGTENIFNKPVFNSNWNDSDFIRSGVTYTKYDGTPDSMKPSGAPSRFARHTLTIGSDVKKGNIFKLNLTNGNGPDTFYIQYTAGISDTAETVAFNIKQQLIGIVNRIFRKTPDMPEANIYNNIIDINGNVSFSYIIKANKSQNYISPSSSVNPVQFNTLKDTGQSLSNIKLGSSTKYGIMYEDFDGRKSLVYTDDTLIVNIKTINDLIINDGKTGYQSSIVTIQINHYPPKWAKYFQIVRSNDLIYGDYIHLLIQKVINFNSDDAQDYLDLVVGSLFTYQKIHPNTSLKYDFKKGDRLRLLKNSDTGVYYPFFETEIIAYNTTVVQNMKDNVVTDGSAVVKVSKTNSDDIGKFIQFDGIEREILGVQDTTHYLLNNVVGDSTAKTYLTYDLIDRRGTVRIRKPADISIADNSMVEIYKPSNLSNPLGAARFNEFQKKFPVINPGTDIAYHTGDIQSQDDILPCIISVAEGTAYVRNREMPLNNSFPGTQLAIEVVEDPSYSDFYPSLINDNGRINVEDNGDGEVHFGSRMWFSNNFIEDTRINGLNDFNNLDREDYNDQYGDIVLTKFDMNRIITFKELVTAQVPVDSIITTDNKGLSLDVSSNKLLNPIQYYAWEGGIGNNPESYAVNGTHRYFVSANSGVIIRLGGNGEQPISKTYALDNEVKSLLDEAIKNNAKIFGGFDRKNGVYVVTIEGYKKYIYFDGFNYWILEDELVPETTLFEIVSLPLNGTAILSSGFEITYQPSLDYVGKDSFTYRAFINGVWSSPKKACIDIVDAPVQLAWRQVDSDFTCVLDQYGLRTGFKAFNTLEEYNIVTGDLTGNTKPNVDTDFDYVPPIYDDGECVPQPVMDIPGPIIFVPVIDADLSTLYESNEADISGINIPIELISVDGYEIRVNGLDWSVGPLLIVNLDKIQTRRLSSDVYETKVTSSVSANGVIGTFEITTKGEVGNEFRSKDFRRDNCNPATETGTIVPTSVEPNIYFADTVAEANALADAYIDSVGQANANAQGYCLLNSTNSIAIVDMFNDGNLDVGVYIDTPGVTESGVMCYTGANFYLPTDPAATAFLLSSDHLDDFTNKRRFAINVGKLIGMYPDDVAIPQFIFKIRGRSTVAGTKSGQYSLKDPTRTLIMTGSPGTYQCGAVPAGGPVPSNWSGPCPAGGDGSIGMGIGDVIVTFTYNRAANTFVHS